MYPSQSSNNRSACEEINRKIAGGDNRRGRQAYRNFIIGGIRQEVENPLKLGAGDGIVGKDGLIERVKETFVSNDTSPGEQPAVKILPKIYEPDGLIEYFFPTVGKSRQEICKRGMRKIERAMLMELLYRFCQILQPQIGKLVGGIDDSAVRQARKRLKERILRDSNLNRRFDELTDQLIQVSKGKDLTPHFKILEPNRLKQQISIYNVGQQKPSQPGSEGAGLYKEGERHEKNYNYPGGHSLSGVAGMANL